MTTLPEPAHDWALFLDVDGTLIHIAEHPDSVQPPDRLREILEDVATTLNGALALISGRSIAAIDALTGHAAPAASGLHGLETRTAGGEQRKTDFDASVMDAARGRLESLITACPDLFLEDKQATLALHYRSASDSTVAQARRTVASIIEDAQGALTCLDGKAVYEIKPAQGDKGKAVRDLLASAPFAGRRPVYIGDDVTDEAGFAAVNALGGISIRVGDAADSAACYQLNTVDEVLEWLEATASTLRRATEPRT